MFTHCAAAAPGRPTWLLRTPQRLRVSRDRIRELDQQVADAAWEFQREVEAGRRVIVGVNEYVEDDSMEVREDTPLISSGLVDSFSMVSLKRFLEMKYKISIPDEDASPEAFDSVNKIADLVTRFTS